MAELIDPGTLREQVRSDQAPTIVDVRDPAEYAAGHLPGAVNLPLDQLSARLAEVPRDRPVVTY